MKNYKFFSTVDVFRKLDALGLIEREKSVYGYLTYVKGLFPGRIEIKPLGMDKTDAELVLVHESKAKKYSNV